MMSTVFVKKRNFELKLDEFIHKPVFDLAHLRALVLRNGAQLKVYGSDMEPACISDDILIVAACSGMVNNLNFLDVLDSFSEKSACLCCYRINSKKEAAVAESTLLAIKRYYDVRSYIESLAYIRCIANMTKDLSRRELQEIKDHLNALDSTSDMVRRINSYGDLCVSVSCKNQVWVYASSVTKPLLRSLCRKFIKRIKIENATAHFDIVPRFRYRMFVVTSITVQTAEVLKKILDWACKRLAAK